MVEEQRKMSGVCFWKLKDVNRVDNHEVSIFDKVHMYELVNYKIAGWPVPDSHSLPILSVDVINLSITNELQNTT